MKTGTDLDESLYDQNEVVLNAKKFDSLFRKVQFNSTDDIDELGIENLSIAKESKKDGDVGAEEEKKTYTGTINSKEFREYLKDKGLTLYPAKPVRNISKDNGSGEKKVLNNMDTQTLDSSKVESEKNANNKKKTVLSRLSSIFSKSKTTPKLSDFQVRQLYGDRTDGSALDSKRVILRNDNRPVLANDEFFSAKKFYDNKRERTDNDDDNHSSISSVLTAAGEGDSADEKKPANGSIPQYRNIDLSRSKLYRKSNQPLSFDNVSKLSDDIIKPRVYRPASVNRTQPVSKSLIKPPVTFRRSVERQSLPILKSNRSRPQVEARPKPELLNNFRQEAPNGFVPSRLTSTPKSATSEGPPVSMMDPFTYAKIHEIKRKTDEVLLNKSLTPESNNDFSRNSAARSTISDTFNHRPKEFNTNSIGRMGDNYSNGNYRFPREPTANQPQRSQSVLDNMTCFKNSLYGEVVYRQPNESGSSTVIMRRPSTQTLDKKQIMDKIYEYYRKSVNSTPLSFQDPRGKQSQFDTSPVSYASSNPVTPRMMRTPSNMQSDYPDYSSYKSVKRRNYESDNESVQYDHYGRDKLSSNEALGMHNRNFPQYSKDAERNGQRIYDVVYGSINRQDGYAVPQKRTPPVLPHQVPVQPKYVRTKIPNPSLPQHLPNQVDILYNNQIYRPISEIQPKSALPQRAAPQLYTNRRRELITPVSDGSETGEVHRIMQNRYAGNYR